jgi:hypothetical protein
MHREYVAFEEDLSATEASDPSTSGSGAAEAEAAAAAAAAAARAALEGSLAAPAAAHPVEGFGVSGDLSLAQARQTDGQTDGRRVDDGCVLMDGQTDGRVD